MLYATNNWSRPVRDLNRGNSVRFVGNKTDSMEPAYRLVGHLDRVNDEQCIVTC